MKINQLIDVIKINRWANKRWRIDRVFDKYIYRWKASKQRKLIDPNEINETKNVESGQWESKFVDVFI